MSSTIPWLFPLIVLLYSLQADGYGSGAPLSTCPRGNVIHRSKLSNYTEFYPPQPETSNPFVFDPDFEKYDPGMSHRVAIMGQNGTIFKGFFLQARIIGTSKPVGEFKDLPALTKIVQCSGTDDSVTHTGKEPKEALSFLWIAPEKCVGNISFIGSIALGHSTFYVDMSSPTLQCSTAGILQFNLCVLIIGLFTWLVSTLESFL